MQLTAAENNLHKQVKSLVTLERKTLAQMLTHLQRVHETRLFAKLGHSSLIKYLIKEFSYSESAAYRRVQALKLTQEIPLAQGMISSGALNLSNISKLQNTLKEKDTETKQAAMEQIAHKSTDEAQKLLFGFAPEKTKEPRESKKRVSEENVRISVNLSNNAMARLDELKARTKCYDTGKLLEQAIEVMLASVDPLQKKTRKSKGSKNTRVIPAEVKRAVYQRAQGMCEHPGCGEKHFLEYDHIKMVIHGGTNEQENLRLVCKAHNQLYAIQNLGMSHMNKFFN